MPEFRVIRNDESEQNSPAGIIPLKRLEQELVKQLADESSGAVSIVDMILRQAVYRGASDIHFDPWEDCLAVRFRIDGILHNVAAIPKQSQEMVTARLKILARIVVYQKDLPQDGRIDPPAAPGGQAMRVSTFPTVHGEKTVVRILGSAKQSLRLDELGFQAGVVAGLRELIGRPQGTLLLTGPSSSGKTTTIYALLQELTPRGDSVRHIVTVEDPVECRLVKIAQTEIKPHAGFTFQTALRSVLRQDPEVIMVGEIRDAETAQMAIQAGLTGHLVISTIHSGTAAGVFTRLLDMGIEPFLIASSLTGVLAQRLVRRNCPHCVKPYQPEAAVLDRFSIKDEGTQFMRGAGCDACQGIGYRGRTAIGELLFMSEELAELVLGRPRTRILHEAAVRNRMVTLAEDATQRVREGVTSLDELKRVLPPGTA